MQKHVAISVLGKDRPGIVAAVSKVFFETGCNIEDSSMTLLRSEFAMILIVALPEKLTAAKLKSRLSVAGKKLGLSIFVRNLSENEKAREAEDDKRYVVAVYGADKPGIVYTLSKLFADNGINITDVQTSVQQGRTGTVYIMFLEATLPKKTSLGVFKSKLSKTAKRLKVTVHVNPVEASPL